MSNESTASSTTAPTTQPGPDLLAERTLAGVFVHLLGVATSFVLPGIVYLVSDHEFTRANARNAFNWQVSYAALTAAAFGGLGLLVLADSAVPGGLPDEVGLGLFFVFGTGFYTLGIVFLLNLVFSLVATAKAIFGDAWSYPVAPDVVSRARSATDGGPRWWLVIAAYVLVAPVVFAHLAWLALGNDVVFWPFFALLVATVIGAPFTAAALIRDARRLHASQASWRPSWPGYVGIPVGVAVLVYLPRTYVAPSANPGGDAAYAFMAALWLASVAYLAQRYRNVGAS